MVNNFELKVTKEDFEYNSKWNQYEFGSDMRGSLTIRIKCKEDDILGFEAGLKFVNNFSQFHSWDQVFQYLHVQTSPSWLEEEDDIELSWEDYKRMLSIETIVIDGDNFEIWLDDGYSEQCDGLYFGHGLFIAGNKDDLMEAYMV